MLTRCPDTGLAVPECSCKRCLEAMLAEFRPGLLSGQFTVTRLRDPRQEEPGAEQREAA